MKQSGITRRIDELGRVVIPKEIRNNMHIKSGDLLEIYLSDEKTIILKKHSIMDNSKEFIENFVNIYSNILNIDIYITDLNKITFSSVKHVIGKKLASNFEQNIGVQNPTNLVVTDDIILNDNYKIYPLLPNGDLVGSIILHSKGMLPTDEILKTSYRVIEKYLESE